VLLQNERYDAVVIGSGIGGLTAALTLARRGRRVVVLEAARQFGGYLNPFARKRYVFDTGLHYVGEAHPGGALHEIFGALGLDIAFNELSPDGFDHYVFPDYQVRMCKGAERFRDRLADDFPRERDGLDRFFALLAEIRVALRTLQRIEGLPSALAALPRLAPALRWRKATAGQLLDDCVVDRRLKAALSGLCGDMGLPPPGACRPCSMSPCSTIISTGPTTRAGARGRSATPSSRRCGAAAPSSCATRRWIGCCTRAVGSAGCGSAPGRSARRW
jgi:phytoene dehydrogenase-like protein